MWRLGIALALAPAVTFAQSGPSGLGQLIGQAEACGLLIDPARAAEIVKKSLPPGDMDYSMALSGWVTIGKTVVMNAGAAERAALCEAARINADALGLTAP